MNIEKLISKLSIDDKMKVLSANTTQAEFKDIYDKLIQITGSSLPSFDAMMTMVKEFNPLLNKVCKLEQEAGFAGYMNKKEMGRNWKMINKGIIPPSYIKQFWNYVRKYTKYFTNMFDVSFSKELVWTEEVTLQKVKDLLVMNGKVIVSYDEERKAFGVWIPGQINVDEFGLYAGATNCFNAAIFVNWTGFLNNEKISYNYKSFSNKNSVLFQLNRDCLGMFYTMKDFFLKTIFFEKLIDTNAQVFGHKLITKVSDVTQDDWTGDQYLDEECAVIKVNNFMSNRDTPTASLPEVMQFGNNDAINHLTNYIDWRVSYFCKLFDITNSSICYKKANLTEDENEDSGVQVQVQKKEFLMYFKAGFDALNEIFPNAPLITEISTVEDANKQEKEEQEALENDKLEDNTPSEK